jgi:hypothetical protein
MYEFYLFSVLYINLKYRINLITFSKIDDCTKHTCTFWYIKNMMKVCVSLCWLILITVYNNSQKKKHIRKYLQSTCTVTLTNIAHIFPVLFFTTFRQKKIHVLLHIGHFYSSALSIRGYLQNNEMIDYFIRLQ